ncbi:MAG: hypothetical protein SPL80_03380 [Bacilli bacterium]|nr:hypothetical protein [Bacilli bacterium]
MEKYERTISLRTIYLTLLRRTEAILIIFFPLALASFLVTSFMIPKQYTTTSSMANGTAITQINYDLLKLKVQNDEVYSAVEANLKTSGIKHSNGKEITKSEISFGLSFSAYKSNMVSFTISFVTQDQSVAKDVLTEYTNVALETLAPNWVNLRISQAAGNPVKTSKENTYLLVGVATSLVLALGIPFVYEIVVDQVYDHKDIEAWGAPAFDLYVSGK